MSNFRPNRFTGSHLYKYAEFTRPEWLKGIILTHQVYFPTINELNDPSDARPLIAPMSAEKLTAYLLKDFVRRHPNMTYGQEFQEEMKIWSTVQKYGVEEVQRRFVKELYAKLKYRIYSLSRRGTNLSMWAKYAGNHTGYCLEFINDGPFAHSYEVTYGETIAMDVSDPQQVDAAYIFRKRVEWSPEEEVRIFIPSGSGPMVRFEARHLARVVLGKEMSERNREMIQSWAKLRIPGLAVADANYDELRQSLNITARAATSR